MNGLSLHLLGFGIQLLSACYLLWWGRQIVSMTNSALDARIVAAIDQAFDVPRAGTVRYPPARYNKLEPDTAHDRGGLEPPL